MYLALYRKYRPKTFGEVIGQNHIVTTLKNQIKEDKNPKLLLFELLIIHYLPILNWFISLVR